MNTENLTQMRRDLPNMYLIAMRGDSKVRISYNAAVEMAGEPVHQNEGAETDSAPEVEPVVDVDAQLVEYFADLAEESGLSDVAEELAAQVSEPKPEPKAKRKATDVATGDTPVKRKRAKKEA